MKKTHSVLCAAFVVAAFAAIATAETLAEKNYAYGGLGIYQFGDKLASETLGTGFALEGGANFNVAPQIDMTGVLRYYSVSKNGYTFARLNLGCDGSYWLMPGQTVNPYIGGGLFLSNFQVEYKWDTGFGTVKADDSETKIGLKFFGGADFNFDPNIWLRAGLIFEFISNYNDVALGVSGGFQITEQIIPYAKLEYWTDPGDVVFIVGGIFKF